MKKRKNIFIKRVIDAIKNDQLYDKLVKEMEKPTGKDKPDRK